MFRWNILHLTTRVISREISRRRYWSFRSDVVHFVRMSQQRRNPFGHHGQLAGTPGRGASPGPMGGMGYMVGGSPFTRGSSSSRGASPSPSEGSSSGSGIHLTIQQLAGKKRLKYIHDIFTLWYIPSWWHCCLWQELVVQCYLQWNDLEFMWQHLSAHILAVILSSTSSTNQYPTHQNIHPYIHPYIQPPTDSH